MRRPSLRGDLVVDSNIFHDCLGLPQAKFFESPVERDLRRHYVRLRHRRFCLLRRKASFSARLRISKSSTLPPLTLSRDCWTYHSLSCTLRCFDSKAPSIYILHHLRRFTVSLYWANLFLTALQDLTLVAVLDRSAEFSQKLAFILFNLLRIHSEKTQNNFSVKLPH